ncbi:cyclic nucleotide-binding domain-containing protein [uncultured Brachyspira sp.]|uniref:Crp/Fnr family transcriptional regulator n=1 Tax=uncultured Brachyspira sp. TaxID=221953 RepID=UPI00261BAB1E|nr:cyclic nucleotide-binding domain-containing protein [uncultured Brachyspira sp.]
MSIYEIEKINDKSLINKIYNYLIINIERWLNRYYYFLYKSNNPYGNINSNRNKKLNIIEMGKIYSDNGFEDAAYKLYKKYIELNNGDEDTIEEVSTILKTMTPLEGAEKLDENIYKYKKGFCLYTELQSNDYLYIIKNGEIGVYNIFDSKQVTRRILSSNDILNGYTPILKDQPLYTTAIVLKDSIIQLAKKEELMDLVVNDRTLRLYFVKIMSMRVYSTISRIRAFKSNNAVTRFVIIIEALLKMELLFKNFDRITLPYNINDICSMIGVQYYDDIIDDLGKIKALNVSLDGYLIVTNVEEFYKEYDIYKQRNTYKLDDKM